MLIVQSSVTGWRSLIAGAVLCLASSAHSATTHFKSSEFIGFLLRRSPRILLRTAHWRRQVFSAKGYSDITTSSKAFTSMQLSMDAFLTPIETPNQAIQRTAGRAAFPLSMTSTFNLQRRALSPAVADLVSR